MDDDNTLRDNAIRDALREIGRRGAAARWSNPDARVHQARAIARAWQLRTVTCRRCRARIPRDSAVVDYEYVSRGRTFRRYVCPTCSSATAPT
jgi:hypothetical protein